MRDKEEIRDERKQDEELPIGEVQISNDATTYFATGYGIFCSNNLLDKVH